ncbi:MAG: VWA domain-containing protein [Candidatus Abyssobacteria bacterium SURF_17]|uniref:VWA domain-containing protein n=1 Tax=Candidatus Abyssobacteria bacterium SURF_17 TaxID=2093361 RepID=A0A419EXA0_9BACT|nr:MAG: VWA domain-containing protein [Candidatus Abyssubacteria bacterium SURF_17]
MKPKQQVNADVVARAISKAVENAPDASRAALGDLLETLARLDSKIAVRCSDAAAGILLQLSPSQQAFFLAHALALAAQPRVAGEFFCRCADLLQHLDEDAFRSWVEKGRAIGQENEAAAVAFFRQESHASISALQELRKTVHIAEVTRLLHLFCTAIAGRTVGVKSTAEAPEELIRKGHHLPLTDGKSIYLPGLISRSASHRENFEEYKVLAAHQAGYIEFGTFELDIDALLDHPALAAFERKGKVVDSSLLASHYELFFQMFDEPHLVRDIFFALEDGRIDFRLREKYRGLAPELAKVAASSLNERPEPLSLPLQEALVESLIRLSISGQIEEDLPHEALPIYRRMCGFFSRVLRPHATVTDSAVATASIYSALHGLPNISLRSPSCPDALREAHDTPLSAPPADARSDGKLSPTEVFPYQPVQPVAYRGQTAPELVQLAQSLEILRDGITRAEEDGIPLTRELLEELLRRGAKIKISQMTAKQLAEASGLFITDLKGVLQEKLKQLTPEERRKFAKLLEQALVLKREDRVSERVFYYDEWDYLIGDYRPRWCRVREIPLEGGSGEIVARIQKEYSALIATVRRHFQRIRPEMLKRVKRLKMGEEIELNDAVDAVIERRAGLTPSERIYQKRDRRTRDVATAFLLDLSASTDEWVVEQPMPPQGHRLPPARRSLFDIFARGDAEAATADSRMPETAKRVIDVEREALVIMAEALESLGDEYAIYGFSGYGREDIEFFPIKDFSERYSEQARRRIGALKPRKSTRMGPAIRHTLAKLAATGCRLKVLILLSDGYPQDFDYGPDRSSRDYGLHDTTVALQEARRNNIHTFCVTVDQAGNDYLREMCRGENYLVVKKPSALPRILPRVYRGLTV